MSNKTKQQIRKYQEKLNFDGITSEQIAHGIQTCENEITRILTKPGMMTDQDKKRLETARLKIIESRHELAKRAKAENNQGKLF